MQVNLNNILNINDKIAVAVSGGCDSMCLLHYLCNNACKHGFQVIALNVEHGIRGKASVSDSAFVKDYCEKQSIPLLSYTVDAIKHSKDNKLSLEQSARILRYDCFSDALKSGKCTKIATAHHRDDNVETVLFNLFRGTGLKGLIGITRERADGIIRPFLSVDRKELEEYAKLNEIPFITDETNLTDDYTRNNIRHNIVPKIKELFPELTKSVERLSGIAQTDDEYLNSVARSAVRKDGESVKIPLPCHTAILSRAIIIALKSLGVEKDWEKTHIDQAIELASLNNGAKLSLPKGVTAIKEYDKLVFFRQAQKTELILPFTTGELSFNGKTLKIELVCSNDIDLKTGLKGDLAKIPRTAVIRTRREGDLFTKFGGGTKSLNDYFTDKKIPQRERDHTPLLADGNTVLAVFGIAISDKIKVDLQTKDVVSFVIKG